MSATITKGYTFGATELVTNTKLHTLVDSATITAIANTELSVLTLVSMVNGNALFQLGNIPSGAGAIPNANIAMLTMPSMVFGAALFGLATIPDIAGIIPASNLGSGTPSASNYLRGDSSWQTVSSGTSGTFVNGDLSSSKLTVTHNLSLSAPYTRIVKVVNNSNLEIIPDNITFATNSFEIDLTSYGTISGTWGYRYI